MDTPTNLSELVVVKRDGSTVPFDGQRIEDAIRNAFIKDASGKLRTTASAQSHSESAKTVASVVVDAIRRRLLQDARISVGIEEIQDRAELELMRSGHYEVARDYVLFREAKAKQRQADTTSEPAVRTSVTLKTANGDKTVSLSSYFAAIAAAAGNDLDVDVALVQRAFAKDLFDGVTEDALELSLVFAARMYADRDPDYTKLASRLLLRRIYKEVLGDSSPANLDESYAVQLKRGIDDGIALGLVDQRLANFDFAQLAAALRPDCDRQFDLVGLQTLYDRYFLVDRSRNRRLELPQTLLMRVSMGLSLNEPEPTACALEFYAALSALDLLNSTPTLFNSGLVRSQLSSCYISTVPDDLDGIFGAIKENALLQKYAGGLGNDWTPVRAMGSHIKGTNGESQGVVPFLKVVNDTAVAVNQGGKRKGAVCTYLETWHLDIEEFLELRKNTGDDRRRTHDMNTANWVPDLFMRRVRSDSDWTLFCPSETGDLHDLYGDAFVARYTFYEQEAAAGRVRRAKVVRAKDLWKKMLTMLFETGHPWITFKDAINVRSPQQHAGVVHSSNLCTEITLNTSETEIAVCNLASVNLVNHLRDGAIDHEHLRRTVRTAMRMLDNVIDLNFYGVEKAKRANLKHRPVGLGLMGYQDALFEQGLSYDDDRAIQFASDSMEAICYYAYEASALLASERGTYPSYQGSDWSKGILPLDTMKRLAATRESNDVAFPNVAPKLDWEALRTVIARYGMRNSNCVAIAPTATISRIVGVSASIEPQFDNLYVASNMSGEFTVYNRYLVRELKALGLWDEVMSYDLKAYDGDLSKIARVPRDVAHRFRTAFSIDASALIDSAAARQVWMDQAQSLNIYMAGASGSKLDAIYQRAWQRGLKTTYYLRTLSASSVEKSTGNGGELNQVPASIPTSVPKACAIDDPTCEACQ